METYLLPEIYDNVCAVQVNPEVGRDEVRGVPFVNGKIGKVEQEVPKNKRLRLRHDGWGKRLVKMERIDGKVKVEFDDDTMEIGHVLIGADGNSSIVRKYLAPETHQEQFTDIRDNIDPLYFGNNPETNLYFSWIASDEENEELFKLPLMDLFKNRAQGFFPQIINLVESLPEDTVVTKVNLIDWPVVEWDN
ncbi:hypothetical protein GQ43DRAFT_474391 [Delitschia confertaspora ATCC 74209]|uniref:FAD-binding domain-containing protein n=1 Tax=Delitschia confertaspora ATCC 74209 TaxID=1513339 RepID=A0A9P4JK39_9PLEO|nr:hypothetical protein GQ43DRAFT_474391 [Delitschia confertaspora ATCC 74209]